MPKVSVVIPTYNRAYCVADAIRSVQSQSLKDAEIIVVDDGSTDDTREVVSAFRVIYEHQENQGVVGAQNRGIALASGEYVALLGSDDALLEGALAKGVRVLDEHRRVGFSYGQAYLVDENGLTIGLKSHGRHSYVRKGRDEIRQFAYGNHVPAPTVMIRRSCLEETGAFDAHFKEGSEDYDLWVRLSKRYDVAYIAEPLVRYRVHSGAIGAGRSLAEIEHKHQLVLESIFSDTELRSLFHLRPDAYFYLYLRLAEYAYGARDMRAARRYLSRAAQIQPRTLRRIAGSNWVFLQARTWLPVPVLRLLKGAKHSARRGVSRRDTKETNAAGTAGSGA